MHPSRRFPPAARLAVLLLALPLATHADAPPLPATGLFSRTNLVAWCIVPFDARKRGPEERAAMLDALGIRRLAYDYRAEHIPTFDAEIRALKLHGIELTAWWFPTTLNAEARLILDTLRRHDVHPQLWVMGGPEDARAGLDQDARVAREVDRLRPIVAAAAAQGCPVGLYNHGGWFGQPENQLQIIAGLRAAGLRNVGIVYNLHHGHEHLDRFAALWPVMQPHLLALNLNGMDPDGEARGRKILPVGEGTEDLRLLTLIRASGWFGPVGILNHTDEDAEDRLRRNLAGLADLVARLP